ncbi:hypothetical protein CYY_002910 [Polysphondylium violaceum]|uniref:Succinate dehydrogenase assembly factor 4, mitochondrial n=1 Tax=Polysphondylium violaceum TaxID=133409 RepID=A0A8J4Q0H6_9MYCE|nr:hypothetical protein CYY_002910 [Polysphondylium violaceum]
MQSNIMIKRVMSQFRFRSNNIRFYSTTNTIPNNINNPKGSTTISQENQQIIRELEEEQEEDFDFSPYVNPVTGEVGGPKGPEPTRYNDWERAGRVSDF